MDAVYHNVINCDNVWRPWFEDVEYIGRDKDFEILVDDKILGSSQEEFSSFTLRTTDLKHQWVPNKLF